jgi:hypothetical protein
VKKIITKTHARYFEAVAARTGIVVDLTVLVPDHVLNLNLVVCETSCELAHGAVYEFTDSVQYETPMVPQRRVASWSLFVESLISKFPIFRP